jgi:hypothetical protein
MGRIVSGDTLSAETLPPAVVRRGKVRCRSIRCTLPRCQKVIHQSEQAEVSRARSSSYARRASSSLMRRFPSPSAADVRMTTSAQASSFETRAARSIRCVTRPVGLSTRGHRVLSIAGVFLCGRREVPIPAICRARYVQGFRVSRQHRGMKAGDSSRRAFPSGAGNRGPRWSPSFRRPWPCGGCLARVVPSSLRPRCRPYVQTRAGTGTRGRGDDH